MNAAREFDPVEARVVLAAECLRNGQAIGQPTIDCLTFARSHLRIAARDAVETLHPATLRINRLLQDVEAEIASMSGPEAA